MREVSFKEGDLVYLTNSATKVGESKKLNPVWVGPFLVVKKLSSALFEIRGKKKSQVVHHDRLKLCRDRFVPFWLKRLRHEFLQLDSQL